MEKNYTVIDGELVHWGIPGMRWGVRRYQNKDGSLTSAGKKRYDSEMAKLRADKKVVKTASATKAKLDKLNAEREEVSKQKKALFGKKKDDNDEAKKETASEPEKVDARKLMKKKKASQMTDEELKAVIDRMQLEKSYKDLLVEMDKNTRRTEKAKEVVENSLIKSGENLVSQVFNQIGTKALNAAFDKFAGGALGDKDENGKSKPVIFTNNKKGK